MAERVELELRNCFIVFFLARNFVTSLNNKRHAGRFQAVTLTSRSPARKRECLGATLITGLSKDIQRKGIFAN